jgi:hypothetical protein
MLFLFHSHLIKSGGQRYIITRNDSFLMKYKVKLFLPLKLSKFHHGAGT